MLEYLDIYVYGNKKNILYKFWRDDESQYSRLNFSYIYSKLKHYYTGRIVPDVQNSLKPNSIVKVSVY